MDAKPGYKTDETDVEHAGGSPALSPGISGRAAVAPSMGGLAPVGYQGFESREEEDDDAVGSAEFQAVRHEKDNADALA